MIKLKQGAPITMSDGWRGKIGIMNKGDDSVLCYRDGHGPGDIMLEARIFVVGMVKISKGAGDEVVVAWKRDSVVNQSDGDKERLARARAELEREWASAGAPH